MGHQLKGSFLVCNAKKEDSYLVHALTVPYIGIVGHHECENMEDTFAYFLDGDSLLALRDEFPHTVIEDIGI